jgi:long-chain fatty acid transport protein
MFHPILVVLTLGLVALGWASPALAGGLYVSEFATSDMGAAGSGMLAGGSGPGAAVANPATMTLLDSHQLHMGLAPGASVVRFDQDSDTPVAGNNGGDQGGFIPLLSTGYVHKLSDRLRLGFGAFSISGAALDPKSDWAGRNQVTNIQLFSVSFIPTVGVRLTDWLSVGAGPFITYATLDWKLKAPLPGPGGNEGDVKLDDMDDWGVAGIVGLMIEPTDDIRVGIVYQSKTKLTLSGDADLPGALGSVNTKLRLPLPHAIRADVRWQALNDLGFSFGGGWENWDELEDTRLSLGDARSTIRLGFKDTYKLRAGIHYQLADKWMVQTGLSFDSSALRTADRTPALPIDKQWRWGIGGTYAWGEGKKVGYAFQYTNLGDAKIENAALKGKYKNNEIFFFVMTLNFETLPWEGMGTF